MYKNVINLKKSTEIYRNIHFYTVSYVLLHLPFYKLHMEKFLNCKKMSENVLNCIKIYKTVYNMSKNQ